MKIIVRLAVILTLSMAVGASAASAAPQFGVSEDGEPYSSGFGGYQTIDQVVNRGDGATVTLTDTSVCADDAYDPDLEDGDGGYVDRLGNNFGMVGATVFVEGNAGGAWTTIAKAVVARADMEENTQCEGETDDDGRSVMTGQAQVDMKLKFNAPAVRQQVRLRVAGGSVVGDLVSQEETLFPRFPEQWQWKTARNVRNTQLTLNTDPRLVGVRATFFLSTDRGFKTWTPTKTAVVKKRGSKGSLRLKASLPAKAKRNWRAFVCLGYQAKYPLMNTGNACPSGKVSGTELERLFPRSTLGPL